MKIMILMGVCYDALNDIGEVDRILEKMGWVPSVLVTDTTPTEVNGARYWAYYKGVPCMDTDIKDRLLFGEDYEYRVADYIDALIVLRETDYSKRMLRIMRNLEKPCHVEDISDDDN